MLHLLLQAISVTITTFITEPLKHFGQGISEFLRALLKDLPVTLQIPVLLTIVLSIVVMTPCAQQYCLHTLSCIEYNLSYSVPNLYYQL